MIRGANAKFKFQLPYNYNELEKVKITFWQENYYGPSSDRPLPIVKILQQCSQSDVPNELCVTLNQEETLRFVDDRKAYVQLRASTLDGIPIVSQQNLVTVYPVHDDSILDDIVPTPTYDGWIYLDGSTIV